MRQAGRHLPEYNAIRKRAGSFPGLAKNPDYALEVTLQPLARFPLDAANLFSDILTVPDAMDLGLYFAEGEGPKFERLLHDEVAIRKIAVPDIGATLQYVTDAVSQIRRVLDGKVLLIGVSGSPYPLACYRVEGGRLWLEDIAAIGCDALGLDWTCDIGQARARVGAKVALQGNLDPMTLFAQPEAIRTQVAKILASYGPGAGHVFNLGHGVHSSPTPITSARWWMRCMI